MRKINEDLRGLEKKIGEIGAAKTEEPPTGTESTDESRVASLRLKGFRRYYDETLLDLDRDFTLVYAPNGVGKSSLVEALELLASGDTSRSGGKAIERKPETSIPSWGLKTDDVEVDLNYCDGAKDTFRFAKRTVDRGRFATISRSTVRSSVTAKSTERFETLIQIAQVPGLLEDYEEVKSELERMERVVKALELSHEDLVERLTDSSLDVFDENFNISLLDYSDPAHSESVSALERQVRDATSLQGQLEAAFSGLHQLTYAPLSRSLKEPTPPEEARLINALEAVQPHLEVGEKCIVCEQSIISSERLEQIRKFLSEHADYLVAKRDFEQDRAVSRLREEFETELRSFKRVLEGLGNDAPNELVERSFTTDFTAPMAESDFEMWKTETSDVLRQFNLELAQHLTSLQGNLALARESQTQIRLNLLNTLGSSIDDRKAKIEDLRSTRCAVKKLKELRAAAKRVFEEAVTGRLEPIQKEIEEWWDLLAPANTDFRLEVAIKATNKNPSVDLKCVSEDSTGKTVSKHAIGHMSDSQLDLLALSIKFASHFPNDGLLWLDDPADMFDEITLEKFCTSALPRLVDSGIQVVLSTHSREIVRLCWKAATESRISDSGTTFGNSFNQISIEVIETDDGAFRTARFTPFDVPSARRQVIEVRSNIVDKRNHWNIAARSIYANQLRRYAEIVCGSLCDSLIQTLVGEPYKTGLYPTDSDATLGTYIESLVQIQHTFRILAMQSDNAGLKANLTYLLDSHLVCGVEGLKGSQLKEGSHGSPTLPTFDELEHIRKSLEVLWPPNNEIVDGELRAPVYLEGFLLEGKFSDEWRTLAREHVGQLRQAVASDLNQLKNLKMKDTNFDSEAKSTVLRG